MKKIFSIGKEEEEESQVNGIDQIFYKIKEENLSKLRKDIHTDTRSTQNTTQTRLEKKLLSMS